jgi:hypothetical protein|tara:strand:+ start:3292 stop:3549 length:258 start_codon:yes stop_codon:yes gene_type:complete
MNEVVSKLKCAICGISAILMSVIGLLVLSQVVFGAGAGIDIIGNLQGIVNGFVGPEASLAGVITLILVVALLQGGGSSCATKKGK